MMRRYVNFFIMICMLAVYSPLMGQFTLGGDDRVNPDDFTITTFADGLNFPVGMDFLPDGSVLVAVSNGSSFWSSTSGSLIQLIDADNDGVAETENTLVSDVPEGRLSALRRSGDIVVTTGQGNAPIVIYRLSGTTDYQLTEVGRMTINYAGPWLHPHSGLAIRPTPGQTNQYDILFHLGSKVNFEVTTDSLQLTSTIGFDQYLYGDAIYMATISDDGSATVTGVSLVQLATGLRSAAGMAFHPVTGDLYLEDNGIDGLTNPIEPHSADELNVIALADIGGDIEDFGFPENYIEYRTGTFIGGGDIAPLVAFLPLPDPATGAEAEGPNDVAFAPAGFPDGLNNGVFVGFHGQFSLGGLDNEENPLVYVDLATNEYFHIISPEEENVGHLDGLLSGDSSLYVADISPPGGLGNSAANSGVIYRIHHGDAPVGIEDGENPGLPISVRLEEAYPNPFNAETTLRYELNKSADVKLTIHNLLGQEINRLVEGRMPAGGHSVRWNGVNRSNDPVASGLFFARLEADGQVQIKRLVLVK